MKLPSKIFTYKESCLSKLAPILKFLEEKDCSLAEVYKANKKIFKNTSDFADCLTVLFALGKIKFDQKSERIELC
ncbi:ABC-three component system middle component 7 [uncultured Treponema sp.]|uniref:ABC-three component system middle component 7 n=1 Tax=uncultured Treponema sp. TaxID=162155 RepID=UPI0025E0A947|nr:ABC-three component system middle component 7 [uncultured Treponema sp.]